MTTARCLSPLPQPRVAFDDGQRVLLEECVVDLGMPFPELAEWALERQLAGGPDWRVSHSHAYTTVLRVPPGFRYDGASIPGVAQSMLMGAKENYEIAGLFHDWAYREQMPRALADQVFHIIARSGSRQVGPIRGWLGWAALRVGGWKAYRRYRA